MIPAPYKGLALTVIVLSGLSASFFSGWWVNGMRHENASLKAQNGAEAKAREQEKVWERKVYDLAYRLRVSQEQSDNEQSAVVTGLNDGTIRLQPRLTCVSQAPAAPSGGDDPPATGLTVSDAVSLIGIAGEGDSAIRQLEACQAYVRQITGE